MHNSENSLSIEEKALQTYQNNLLYFQKKHPEIHKKLSLLDLAINSGQYIENYTLEYKDGTYFDVQEISSGGWLYGNNSKIYSQNLSQTINLKKQGSVFGAQKFIDYQDNELENIQAKDLSYENEQWATIDIIEYCKQNAPKSTTMLRAKKAIFLDTGLGIHISELLKKLNPKVILITENNLELFRLSLFVTNYSEVLKNTIAFFSIADNLTQEKETFLSFLDTSFSDSLYIKFIPFFKGFKDKLQRYQNYVLTQEHLAYPYHAHLIRSIDSARYINSNYLFLDVSQKHSLDLFSNRPVLLVLSGPSAEKNIHWIKENQDKFLIVCALATCKLLYKNDIQADVIINIHPTKDETLRFFKDINKQYFTNATILLASTVHPDIVQEFQSDNIYFIQNGTDYKTNLGSFSASSIGEYSYGLFLKLGVKNIYLLGLDLALDPDTLKSHNSYHPHGTQGKLINDDSTSAEFHVVFVKGNFREKVPTYIYFTPLIDNFKLFSETIKDRTQTVYNLNDGAFLDGSQPLHISNLVLDEFSKLNKKLLHKEFIGSLNTISSNELSVHDKNLISQQIKQAKKTKKLLAKHSSKKYKDVNSYLRALYKLIKELSSIESRSKTYLSLIYFLYIKSTLPYIVELFNTKELNNVDIHINNIDNIFLEQLEKIYMKFIEGLESNLSEIPKS